MMCSESSILVHPIEEKDIFVSGQFYNMVSITGLSCGLARQRDVVGALLQSTFEDYTHCRGYLDHWHKITKLFDTY